MVEENRHGLAKKRIQVVIRKSGEFLADSSPLVGLLRRG